MCYYRIQEMIMKKLITSLFKRITAIMADRSGYNLIELMIVIAIIGVLAVIIVPKVMDLPDKARVSKAKEGISSISLTLDMYKNDNYSYPSTEQGLQALVEKPSGDPSPANYKEGGYLKSVPVDPWGHPYVYECPGPDGADYLIKCLGADGKEGGEKYNTDISNLDK